MISVIVSVYEQAVTLGWLMASLGRQDFRDRWELLVADDGSNPDTLSVVKDASRRYPMDVRYVWQPDAGYRLSRSRNNAVRCAQGDLLIFVDGDMIVRPDFLTAHAALHDGERRIMCGTREWVTVGDDPPPRDIDEIYAHGSDLSGAHARLTELDQQEAWAGSESPWMAMMGCNFSVPAAPEVVFDERFCGWGAEDQELACRLHRNYGYRIAVSDAAEGIHISFGSKPATLDPLSRNDHHGIVKLIRNKLFFRRLHPDVDTKPALQTLLNCFLNTETDTWCYAELEEDGDLERAIEFAELWMDAHGICFRPTC